MHLRDNNGHIYGQLYGQPTTGKVSVPSCGAFVDDYVDRRGFPAAFVLRLYDSRRASTTCVEFAKLLQPLPMLDAEWYWGLMDLPNETVMRIRSFGINF